MPTQTAPATSHSPPGASSASARGIGEDQEGGQPAGHGERRKHLPPPHPLARQPLPAAARRRRSWRASAARPPAGRSRAPPPGRRTRAHRRRSRRARPAFAPASTAGRPTSPHRRPRARASPPAAAAPCRARTAVRRRVPAGRPPAESTLRPGRFESLSLALQGARLDAGVTASIRSRGSHRPRAIESSSSSRKRATAHAAARS